MYLLQLQRVSDGKIVSSFPNRGNRPITFHPNPFTPRHLLARVCTDLKNTNIVGYRGFLVKALKIKVVIKSTGNLLTGIEQLLKSAIFCRIFKNKCNWKSKSANDCYANFIILIS